MACAVTLKETHRTACAVTLTLVTEVREHSGAVLVELVTAAPYGLRRYANISSGSAQALRYQSALDATWLRSESSFSSETIFSMRR